MAQQHEFEDMHWQEWPADLIELHASAQEAWSAYAALEEILANRTRGVLNQDITRSVLTELAGRAYALLRDLRAEGMRQLAEWEDQQRVDNACPKCQGRGYEAIGPLHLNCDACGGTGLMSDEEEGEVPAEEEN